jgi:hypothetical protein
MRMKPWLITLGLAINTLGCASGRVVFNSSADLEAAPPLARVFVLARVKSEGFNEQVYRGFQQSLGLGLASCGVKSELMHVNDLDLDPKERFAQATSRFQPDAILYIREAGGSVIIGTYGTNSDLLFDMRLFDANKGEKPFWHARSMFSVLTRNLYIDDTASGERFAQEIIKRLQADGVLKGCKAPEPEEKA